MISGFVIRLSKINARGEGGVGHGGGIGAADAVRRELREARRGDARADAEGVGDRRLLLRASGGSCWSCRVVGF